MATYRIQMTFKQTGFGQAADQMVMAPHVDVPGAPADAGHAGEILSATRSWFHTLDGNWAPRRLYHSDVFLDNLKAYHVGTPGAPIAESLAVYATGEGAVAGPRDIAMVTTLRTADARVHGRMYWPSCGALYGARLITQAGRETMVRTIKLWQGYLDQHGIGAVVAVYSRRLGTALPVTTVEADEHYDTQRRRDYTGAGATTSEPLTPIAPPA